MGIQDMAVLRSLMLGRDVQGLIDVLRDESRPCPERRFAAAALGNLRAAEAVKSLVSVLNDAKVCEAAVQALVSIGDSTAAAPLAELCASADDLLVRKMAERALHRLCEEDPRGARRVLEGLEQAGTLVAGKPKHGGL
jgi:HEAT repeat protein